MVFPGLNNQSQIRKSKPAILMLSISNSDKAGIILLNLQVILIF